ncbi:hypothetical protein F503_00006 [Ophiostoma piceae UAMH 11346]|uniref:Uncharacterized protein n=1 Tax=Ophiostoma piceae (strain UAMH 11346) TaxID=1262450 RepID=S3BWD2_OPHP1|nr:hypothetical protein F503_00006 [Ophiostoma piceae UAMH 11346]
MPSIPYRAAWLLMAATAVHSIAALSIPPQDSSLFLLFDRADSCIAGFAPCTNANFPDNFCCSSGSTCNALAANTTVVCCPSGSSCAVLTPISCDVTQQDASLHPESSIKTTALNGALPKCAGGCCPFGYSCSSDTCIVNANQNASPIQSAPTKTSSSSSSSTRASSSSKTSTTDGITVIATSTPASASTFFSSLTSTTSPTGTATATDASTTSSGDAGNASANESAVASADNHSGKGSGSTTASIVGGIIGGIAGLVIIGFAAWFILGRRMRSKDVGGPSGDAGSMREKPKKEARHFFSTGSNQSSTSFGHIINNPLAISISSPKPQGNTTAFRTDFIRKPVGSSLGSDSRPGTAASGSALLAQATANATRQSRSQSQMYATPNANFTTYDDSPYDNYGSTYSGAGNGHGNGNGAPSINTLISSSPFSITMPPSPTPPALSIGTSAKYGNKRDSVPPIRGMRPQVRQPSTEEINIGADPSLIRAGGGNYAMSPEGTDTTSPNTIRAIANAALAASNSNLGAPPDDPRRLTTFSSLMAAANLDQSRPFVPR